MRPQIDRRYPDEAFYFDKGELVIDPEVLPEIYPEVILLEGRNVIATFVDGNDQERSNANDVGWAYEFDTGTVITEINTSDFGIQISYSEARMGFKFSGEVKASYQVVEADLLVLKRESLSYGKERVVLHPGTEPLPGNIHDRWRLEAIIRADDKLITWKGDYKRWLSELALASTLVENGVDWFQVKDEIGIERSLVGSVNNQEAVKAYLDYFDQKHGTFFSPTTEPIDQIRQRGIDVVLSTEQFDRYIPHLLW